MRLPVSALLVATLLASPAPALAQTLQFDSSSAGAGGSTPPGLAWLQHQPMTLFDLGMMELSQTATKATEGLFDVAGAVAEYRESLGQIAITFYARTPYSPENCEYVARKMRDQMFTRRDDRAALAHELAAYFTSYGPGHSDHPSTIGAELLDAISFAVFLPGGACDLRLTGEQLTYWKDPNYAPPPPTDADAKTPNPTDLVTKLQTLAKEAGSTLPSEPAPASPAPTEPH